MRNKDRNNSGQPINEMARFSRTLNSINFDKLNSDETKQSRRRYDSTFKQGVLKMVESGSSVPDVAQALGLNTSLIYLWIRLSGSFSSQKRSGETATFFDGKKELYCCTYNLNLRSFYNRFV